MNKVLDYVKTGQKEGAELLVGGSRHGEKGYFVEPSIFTGVEDNMAIAREEIFGPVMSILKFSSTDEVIKRANDSSFGLGAGVVTQSLDTAIQLSEALRVGTVYVNCYNVFSESSSFGGYKDSGIGREVGFNALKNY